MDPLTAAALSLITDLAIPSEATPVLVDVPAHARNRDRIATAGRSLRDRDRQGRILKCVEQ
jgi:hypothetical protein